jgi:hypothetical protein
MPEKAAAGSEPVRSPSVPSAQKPKPQAASQPVEAIEPKPSPAPVSLPSEQPSPPPATATIQEPKAAEAAATGRAPKATETTSAAEAPAVVQAQASQPSRQPAPSPAAATVEAAEPAEVAATIQAPKAAEARTEMASLPVQQVTEAGQEPQISVLSPPSGYQYGARVLVSGKASAPGGLERLTYGIRSPEVFAVSAPALSGQVELKPDGSFAFILATRGLKGPQELYLNARARNGREREVSVPMLPGDSEIPGFRVEPGDGRLTLSWEPLPGAATCTLLYRVENPGQSPGREKQVNGVKSPYVLVGLENGNLYSLRLKAGFAGESDAWSGTWTAIPLSPDTLALSARGEYRRIRLSWKKIPGCGSYGIWRSTSADGVYGQIGGPTADSAYVDEEVRYGQRYFYRIRPSGFLIIESRVAWAEMAEQPEQRVEICGSISLAETRRISIFGAYVFAASGPRGLQIIDVAEPKNPAVVGSCSTEMANDVIVRGDFAYVADGPRGLVAVDVSDPRNPRLIGARKTAEARAVYLKDSYAFVADGPGGLKVLDISSPSQPARLASLATLDARDVTGRGDLVYLADGRGGLLTVDVADPLSPKPLGRLPTPEALAVARCGNLVLLADGEQGLKVIDVSLPAAPVCVGSCNLRGAVDVAGSGQLAYVADEQDGITVVDLSDPRRPVPSATLGKKRARAVEVGEDYAYLVDDRGLSIVRVLVQGISYPVAFAGTDSKAFGVVLSGQRAYVAGHDAGVSVLDVTTPAAAGTESKVAAFQTDYALDVAIRDNILYVADGRRGIKIIDINAPSGSTELAELYTGGEATGVALGGNLLFVAAGPEGVKIVDVSDTREPVQIAESLTRDARDVAVWDDQLLVADAAEGLILFDVSNPASPARTASLPAVTGSRLALRGNTAFVVGPAGLHIVELGPKPGLRRVGGYETPHAEDVAIDGPYAYLAQGHAGLTVLDVSRLESLRPVSACPEVYAVGVAARGDYAFVADSKGLQIIRILIPDWLRRRAPESP